MIQFAQLYLNLLLVGCIDPMHTLAVATSSFFLCLFRALFPFGCTHSDFYLFHCACSSHISDGKYACQRQRIIIIMIRILHAFVSSQFLSTDRIHHASIAHWNSIIIQIISQTWWRMLLSLKTEWETSCWWMTRCLQLIDGPCYNKF